MIAKGYTVSRSWPINLIEQAIKLAINTKLCWREKAGCQFRCWEEGRVARNVNVLSMNVLLKQQAMHFVMQIGRHKIHGMKLIQTLMMPCDTIRRGGWVGKGGEIQGKWR